MGEIPKNISKWELERTKIQTFMLQNCRKSQKLNFKHWGKLQKIYQNGNQYCRKTRYLCY